MVEKAPIDELNDLSHAGELIKQSRWEEAEEALHGHAHNILSFRAMAALMLGFVQQNLKKTTEALASYKEAARLAPLEHESGRSIATEAQFFIAQLLIQRRRVGCNCCHAKSILVVVVKRIRTNPRDSARNSVQWNWIWRDSKRRSNGAVSVWTNGKWTTTPEDIGQPSQNRSTKLLSSQEITCAHLNDYEESIDIIKQRIIVFKLRQRTS